MSAESPVVRRCIAVASHGRRCQQSPFRGSPYCWHHLQSRKVPAPSRLRSTPPAVAQIADGDRLPSIDPMTAALRLVRGLDREAIAALVDFAEGSRDETLLLQRESGAVSVTSSLPRPVRRAAAR